MSALRLMALVTTVLVGLGTGGQHHLLAQQPVTVPQARALEAAADALSATSRDPDALSAAYERALQAYDQLEDRDNGLEMVKRLLEVNYQYCRDPEAIAWTQEGIRRLARDQTQYRTYVDWLQLLGTLYQKADAPEAAFTAYEGGIAYLRSLQQSATADVELWTEMTALARSQLSLPMGDRRSQDLQRQLIELHREAGAVTQVNGLLTDASALFDEANPFSLLALEALQISQQYRYPSGELRALLLLGEDSIADSNYRLAAEYGEQAMALMVSLTNTDAYQAQALYVLAQSQQGLGNEEPAIDAYTEALRLLESAPENSGNAPSIRDVVSSLIDLYQQTGQLAAASRLETTYRDQLAGFYDLRSYFEPFPVASLRSSVYLPAQICLFPDEAPSLSAPSLIPPRPLPLRPSVPIQIPSPGE